MIWKRTIVAWTTLLAETQFGTCRPRRGAEWCTRGGVLASARRWLMPKRRYHIYYRFDAKTQVIVIYTLPPLPTGWHGVLEALTGSVVFVHP